MNLANESGDVWQGSPRVEQDKPVFNLAGGVLEMTSGSSISAQQVIVSGHGSGAILRVGAAPIGSDSWEGKTYELPSLSAVTIDMSHGFDWDLMPFSERGTAVSTSPPPGNFYWGEPLELRIRWMITPPPPGEGTGSLSFLIWILPANGRKEG